MYQMEKMPFIRFLLNILEHLETEFSNLRLVMCRWVTYGWNMWKSENRVI